VLVSRRLEDTDDGNTAVLLVEVHTETNDELIRDNSTDVVNVDLNLATLFLVQEAGNLDRGRRLTLEVLLDPGEGGTSINEVLNDENVTAVDIHVEVLLHGDGTSCVGTSIGRDGDEVKNVRDFHLANEVSNEKEATLEETNNDDFAVNVGIILRDLLGHLGDHGVDLLTSVQHFADVVCPSLGDTLEKSSTI